MAAFSLVELVIALGIAATLASFSLPTLSASTDDVRAVAAVRHVVSRLQAVRVRAVMRGRDTALRIGKDARGYSFSVYEDGNRNGVLARDIQDGTDPVIGPAERLIDQFPGIDFGALAGLPGAEGSAAPGADPIRLGASDAVTFSPLGTSSSGSLYVRGRGAAQYVVRIYGETGRVRVLKFNAAAGSWQPL